MAVESRCKLQLSSMQIFLTANLMCLISPEISAGKKRTGVESYCLTLKKQDRGGPKTEASISLQQEGSFCQRSPHTLSHPSHSLGVTQEQFVKLFFHVIASKSNNLPRQWSWWASVSMCWGVLSGRARPETLVQFSNIGYWAWRNWLVNSAQSSWNKLAELLQCRELTADRGKNFTKYF